MTHIGEGGRLVIPAAFRRSLGLDPGTRVILRLEAGTLRLMTPAQAVARAQELVARHVPPERVLSDELLAERKREG